jgi:hypothetical protein
MVYLLKGNGVERHKNVAFNDKSTCRLFSDHQTGVGRCRMKK